MSQLGLAEQVWAHLRKTFPRKPTEMIETSDSSSFTRLSLASCFSPMGCHHMEAPSLHSSGCPLSLLRKRQGMRGASVPSPSCSWRQSEGTPCSTSPWHRRLCFCCSLLRSLLNELPIFVRLIPPMWRALPKKALIFCKRFQHRQHWSLPVPAPNATLTFMSSHLPKTSTCSLSKVHRYQSTTKEHRPSPRSGAQAASHPRTRTCTPWARQRKRIKLF